MSTTTIKSRVAAVVGALLLGVGVASCTDDGEDAEPTSASSTTTSTAEPTVTVTADPPTVTVTPGGPSPDPDPAPGPEDPPYAPGECSIESLHRTGGTQDLDTLIYCDGLWMRAGQWRTDNVRNFYLGGYLWRDFAADGTSEATGYPCYSQNRLDREDVSDGLRAYLLVCEEVTEPAQ